jgi:MFS family permease
MMLLQLAVNGAVAPILSLYLKEYLGFSGAQAGMVMAMSAVSAFLSPLIGAFIADKLIRAERLYAACLILAAAAMFALSRQRGFPGVLCFYLAFTMLYGPTNALANAVVFHNSTDAKKAYGGIRLWGTVGWVAVAWLFGFLYLGGSGGGHLTARLPHALTLSAAISMALGLYALSLPSGRGEKVIRSSLLPKESIRVLRRREVSLFLVFAFLVSILDIYYYFGTSVFLSRMGVATNHIMPLMSVGQIPEIIAFSVMGILLSRLGFKRLFAIGAAAELVRFTVFAAGGPHWLIFSALPLHGIAYAFFSGCAHIYLDSFSSRAARAGVHQLHAIITSGFGNFMGNMMGGRMLDASTDAFGRTDFRAFWALPAAIALTALVFLLLWSVATRGKTGGKPITALSAMGDDAIR